MYCKNTWINKYVNSRNTILAVEMLVRLLLNAVILESSRLNLLKYFIPLRLGIVLSF